MRSRLLSVVSHPSVWPPRTLGVCALYGDLFKTEMDCHETHVGYLAAFAPATFKVGVPRRTRLETRLVEQGADRGALIRTVADGRIAREIEARLADRVGDRVRSTRRSGASIGRSTKPRANGSSARTRSSTALSAPTG